MSQTDQAGPVAGRYALKERLAGGSWALWRAHDQQAQCDVMLLIRAHAGDRTLLEAHFAAEAELSSRTECPNLVRVLDRGIDGNGTAFVVLELLTAADMLTSRIDGGRHLSMAEFGGLVVQLCRALARLHGEGVAHGAVTPEHIFMRIEEGRMVVKLLDAGIGRIDAAAVASATRVPSDASARAYLAPEVLAAGAPLDVQSDLYAAAAVAYRAFTGRVPRLDIAPDGQDKIGSATIPRASSLRAVSDDFGEPLDEWFATGLDRDPAERFQTARRMAQSFVNMGEATNPRGGPESRHSFPSLSRLDLRELPEGPGRGGWSTDRLHAARDVVPTVTGIPGKEKPAR